MNRRQSSSLTAAFALLLVAVPAMAGDFRIPKRAIPGRYIVQLRSDAVTPLGAQAVPGMSVAEQAHRLSIAHRGGVEKIWEHALQGFVFLGDEAAARELARDPRVLTVEQDAYGGELFATQSVPHWGLDRMAELDRPMNNYFTYNTTGVGVNVYILDTGISNDAEFGTRKVDAFTAITDEAGAPRFADCNGHGTKVAKLAGGATSGVAKGAKLYNVRIGSICG